MRPWQDTGGRQLQPFPGPCKKGFWFQKGEQAAESPQWSFHLENKQGLPPCAVLSTCCRESWDSGLHGTSLGARLAWWELGCSGNVGFLGLLALQFPGGQSQPLNMQVIRVSARVTKPLGSSDR